MYEFWSIFLDFCIFLELYLKTRWLSGLNIRQKLPFFAILGIIYKECNMF